MPGTLVITTLSDGTNSTSATNCISGSAKAWVNFVGSTGAIRASYNVSSITRNGVGDYTVNMTNALADANYSVSGLCGGTANVGWIWLADQITARTASLFRFYTLNNTTAVADPAQVNVAVNR